MKNTATLHHNYSVKNSSDITLFAILATSYSKLLNEDITQRKLCHLLHVQLAGIALPLFAAWNTGALIIGLIWFASALYSAKLGWKDNQ